MDGLVQVNGETTEEVPPLQGVLQENVSSTQTQKHHPPEKTVDSPTTAEQQEAPQVQKSSPAQSGSAISSLIAGRNCIITTTIVTELTKTQVEPLHPDIQDNAQVGQRGQLFRGVDSTFHTVLNTLNKAVQQS